SQRPGWKGSEAALRTSSSRPPATMNAFWANCSLIGDMAVRGPGAPASTEGIAGTTSLAPAPPGRLRLTVTARGTAAEGPDRRATRRSHRRPCAAAVPARVTPRGPRLREWTEGLGG